MGSIIKMVVYYMEQECVFGAQLCFMSEAKPTILTLLNCIEFGKKV